MRTVIAVSRITIVFSASVAFSLPVLSTWSIVAAAAEPHPLVIARAGTLPVLLTVPHGGEESVEGVPPRLRGATVRDKGTLELAEALANQLTEKLGAAPYFVGARFSRKYIDANRQIDEAIESPMAKPAYDAYHGNIRDFVTQMKARFPKGAILLDIHGQAADPDAVHRGTRNGRTVSALIGKHGEAALSGPQSILGAVQSKGFRVYPPNTPLGTPPEDRRYNGGYTVFAYGSSNPDGIDALQIEIGSAIRRDASFIPALADAIAVFYRAYLSQ